MYSIFHIEGGIGKNILATAVVSSLKSTEPERNIIVVTAWPQVWFNNPNVHQIYPIGQAANFYKNFIKEKDTKIFRIDPYHTEDYILNKKHLIDIWCDLVGAQNNGVIKEWEDMISLLESGFTKRQTQEISRACRGKIKSYSGFIWKYKN